MTTSHFPALEFPVDFVAEANSELSVDERVEKLIEDKERRAMEAWTMMPRLFDIWDIDASGTLTKNEIYMGIEEYCDAREIPFDSRMIGKLWLEVDDNGDGVLDRQEFAVFLARYCEGVGIALDDMAMVVLRQLAGVAMSEASGDEMDDEDHQPESLLGMLPGFKARQAKKKTNWAQLKIESERMTAHKKGPSSWEALNFNLSMRAFQQAKKVDDQPKKQEAANRLFLWQKLDDGMAERQKRLGSFIVPSDGSKSSVKKPIERRNTISKIEVKSLDGFFSSVGKVVDECNRDREKSSAHSSAASKSP